MTLIDHPALFALVAIANVPIYVLIARSFFDDWGEVSLMLKSMFAGSNLKTVMNLDGESREAAWPTTKLMVLLIVLSLLVVSEYTFIATHFPAVTDWAARVL